MKDFQRYPLELQKMIYSFQVAEVIEGRIGDKIIKLSDENKILHLKSDTDTTQEEMKNEYHVCFNRQ